MKRRICYEHVDKAPENKVIWLANYGTDCLMYEKEIIACHLKSMKNQLNQGVASEKTVK